MTRWNAVWIGLALLAGCGGAEFEATYPVRGSVHVNGQPAAGAFVVFEPATPAEAAILNRPTAWVAADGTFALTTFLPDDGAPVGAYRVGIEWPTSAGETDADPESARSGPDRLRGRFQTPANSGLEASVVAGENQLPPFDLKF